MHYKGRMQLFSTKNGIIYRFQNFIQTSIIVHLSPSLLRPNASNHLKDKFSLNFHHVYTSEKKLKTIISFNH